MSEPLVFGDTRIPVHVWQKIQQNDRTGCWEWAASPGNGYGQVWVWITDATRVLVRPHRFLLAVSLDRPIGAGLQAIHACDNKLCCRPDARHVHEGTRSRNARDAVERGQQPRGERHGCARLTEDDVRLMRTLHDIGWSAHALGHHFGTSFSHAARILRNERWTHVQGVSA